MQEAESDRLYSAAYSITQSPSAKSALKPLYTFMDCTVRFYSALRKVGKAKTQDTCLGDEILVAGRTLAGDGDEETSQLRATLTRTMDLWLKPLEAVLLSENLSYHVRLR